MNSKEAYDKIFDKLTYNQQQELGEEVLRTVYQDLKKLEKLEKENQGLRKSIKSWNENGGNLLKEKTKLKEALNILCEELEIKLCYNNCYDNGMLFDENYYLDYRSDIDLRTLHKITKEQYELLKEVL